MTLKSKLDFNGTPLFDVEYLEAVQDRGIVLTHAYLTG